MHQPEPDHELPYIKQAEREDAYEAARERAVDRLWDNLFMWVEREKLIKHIDTWGAAEKLISAIANHRANEEAGMRNLNLSYEIRKAQRASDRQQFVTELQTVVEELFEVFIEKEIGND